VPVAVKSLRKAAPSTGCFGEKGFETQRRLIKIVGPAIPGIGINRRSIRPRDEAGFKKRGIVYNEPPGRRADTVLGEYVTDAGELKKKISAQAGSLGLSLIGCAPVERWVETGNQKRASFPQTIWPWAKTVIVGGVPLFLPMVETTPSNLYSELYNTSNRLLDEAAYRIAGMLFSLGLRAHFFPRDGYGEISSLVKKPEAAFS
jgi:hypothetical protein